MIDLSVNMPSSFADRWHHRFVAPLMYKSMGKKGGMHDAKSDYRIMILFRTEDIAPR